MRPKQFVTVVLSLVAAASLAARAAGPKVGDAAPPLGVQTLLNAPEGASAEWDKLKGKIVVVDFWATWCGPCVAAIPHMNELAEQFADRDDIVFISRTAEDRATVEAFLKRRPIRGWVALGPDATRMTYYVGLPHTYIVSKDGRVLGHGEPDGLTPAVIEAALEGRPIRWKPPEAMPAAAEAPPAAAEAAEAVEAVGEADDAARGPAYGSFFPGRLPGDESEPIAQVVVRKSASGQYGGSGDNEYSHTYLGFPLAWILNATLPQTQDGLGVQVELPADLPDDVLDVAITVPEPQTREAYTALLEAGLLRPLGLKTRVERRDTDVLLMVEKSPGSAMASGRFKPVADGAVAGPTKPPVVDADGSTRWEISNAPPASLIGLLGFIDMPVVFDETGIDGGFDYAVIEWPHGDRDLETMRAGLDEYGLALKGERRPLTYVIVERAAPATRPAD